ncbi:uncharacterized protein PHALS_05225 [Plasmopara halstedii]|uniref:Uncharacterized protein n=1 Tax=Plasmopara halstedii TaxID=4781 RepID=A0A0P1B120_PLAHL|nr:uncharacterized protein PHALS_05225 [Plasmopara halstedii]CEG47900.1 hypothetical protein PHALS_05225 [Plasmopara halstedii]|eukprot:XP_024584269.1 hypothetical protein PHALS_05225 [Plasmopara halstedii]
MDTTNFILLLEEIERLSSLEQTSEIFEVARSNVYGFMQTPKFSDKRIYRRLVSLLRRLLDIAVVKTYC